MNTASTLLAHFLTVPVIGTLAESICGVLPCWAPLTEAWGKWACGIWSESKTSRLARGCDGCARLRV